MYGEMMQYYGLVKDLDKADYFETEPLKVFCIAWKLPSCQAASLP